jgi:lambda family phage portal protein
MKVLAPIIDWLARQVLARYEGASYSSGRSWIPGGVQSARFDASASTRMELVRKARYFEKNNALLNRMADLFECYTVGTGLPLQPASSSSTWNQSASVAWQRWTELADLTSLAGFGTLLSLAARTWFIDGEVFIILTRTAKGHPRLQLVEGHMVETPPELKHLEGDTIIDGVRIDRNGRPEGYYVAREVGQGKKVYEFKDAQFVIHLFEPSRPGQMRGLPFVYPVINDLHDLDDLQLLEMKAAKDAAEITNKITTESGEIDPDQLRRERFNQSREINTGATVTESKSAYYEDKLGGRTVVLRKGDDMEQYKSDRPSAATSGYWKILSEKICSGVGIPYVLCVPESMQGTVYRGALDMANAFFHARWSVISNVATRVYRFVMGFERNIGDLRDGPADWDRVTVCPPRAVNVDVGRNSNAMLAELEAGASNFEMIYSPMGLDWREQFRKLKEQQDFAREIGLALPSVAAAKPAEPGAPAKTREELEDEEFAAEQAGKETAT